MTWKASKPKKTEIHHQQRPSPLNQHFKLPLSLGKDERRGMRLKFRETCGYDTLEVQNRTLKSVVGDLRTVPLQS